MFTIKVDDQASPLFAGLAETVTDMLQTQVDEISNVLTPLLKQNTPIGKYYGLDGSASYGGQLRDSLRMVSGFLGSTLLGAKQGVFVAGGTRPHPITPKSAPALTFYWARAGKVMRTQHVNHPGNAPNDFRQKAIQEGFDTQMIPDTITRVMSQWLSGNG